MGFTQYKGREKVLQIKFPCTKGRLREWITRTEFLNPTHSTEDNMDSHWLPPYLYCGHSPLSEIQISNRSAQAVWPALGFFHLAGRKILTHLLTLFSGWEEADGHKVGITISQRFKMVNLHYLQFYRICTEKGDCDPDQDYQADKSSPNCCELPLTCSLSAHTVP